MGPAAAPRRFRINPSDLLKHGYTEGCPQCRHIGQVRKPRPGHQHSNACRARVIEAIGGSDAGKARIADHTERLDRATVEFSHPPDVAGDAARPPAEAEFQDAREVRSARDMARYAERATAARTIWD